MAGYTKDDFSRMGPKTLAACARGELDGIEQHEQDYAMAELIEYFGGNEEVANVFQQFDGVPKPEAEGLDVDVPPEHII